MAERESFYLWSVTSTSNASVDPSIAWSEGQLPSTVNNSARAMMAAEARHLKDTNGSLTSTGSANAYLLTINGTQTALATGQIVAFKANFRNTGAATLNVTNGDATALGAKAIRAYGDVALSAGHIAANGHCICRYDAAANGAAGAWILQNPMGYVEGTWSPIDASGAALSFTASSGGYTRIGNMVFAYGQVTYPANTDSNIAVIGGLPFANDGTVAGRQCQIGAKTEATLTGIQAAVGSTTLNLVTATGTGVTNSTMSTDLLWFIAIYPGSTS